MAETSLSIDDAIRGRRSVRAFRSDPIERRLVEHLLDVSARAPSGTNMQPWRVYVLAGEPKERLSADLMQAHASGSQEDQAEYEYYPSPFFDPYLSRRRKVGWDLYTLLGIARGDSERMQRQHARNLAFFGAPVGLMFTLDRRLKIGSWLDYGMFLENVMVAARGHGLETCVQAAFAPFHHVIRRHLPLDATEMVVCGMSLGYEDTSAIESRMQTERVPVREFATFTGFDPTGDDASARPTPLAGEP